MKTKQRYEYPQTEVVCISPFMNEYHNDIGLVGFNTSQEPVDASLGESNTSDWDDADPGTTSKSLWDE